jgi:hypothetical protein
MAKTVTLTCQQAKLVEHLFAKQQPITPLSALVNYGIGRLAARVHELKKLGYEIDTTMKSMNGRRYASYEARV